MKNPSDLYILIKSLSQTEKRYFKLFASMHVKGEQNNYIALFDAIDKMSNHDEKELISKYKNHAFVKHIRFTRHYLYKLILKSLRNYHSENEKFTELPSALADIENLYNKGLYKLCLKICSQLKRKIPPGYNPLFIMILNNWERKIYTLTGKKNKQLIDQHYQSNKALLNICNNLNELQYITDQAAHVFDKHGLPRNSNELQKYMELISFKKLDTFQIRSKEELFYHNNIKAFGNYLLGNYSKSYDYYKKNVTSLTPDIGIFRDEPRMAILSVNGLIISAKEISEKKFLSSLQYLKAFAHLKNLPIGQWVRIYLTLYIFEIDHYVKKGNVKSALKLIPESANLIEQYEDKMHIVGKSILRFNIAVTLLVNNRPEEALDFLNPILNSEKQFKRLDILAFSRILLLFCHYELGNIQYIESLIHSTKRFLTNNNKYYSLEGQILKFFRNILTVKAKQEVKKHYQTLYNKITEYNHLHENFVANEYFDIESWVKSKIESKSFQEVIIRKNKNKATSRGKTTFIPK